MKIPWLIKGLSKMHDRTTFDCGETELNDYLKKFARQNASNSVSKTSSKLVAVSAMKPEIILGFYSMSATSIDIETLPSDIYKK
jgi:hypothetical protein